MSEVLTVDALLEARYDIDRLRSLRPPAITPLQARAIIMCQEQDAWPRHGFNSHVVEFVGRGDFSAVLAWGLP